MKCCFFLMEAIKEQTTKVQTLSKTPMIPPQGGIYAKTRFVSQGTTRTGIAGLSRNSFQFIRNRNDFSKFQFRSIKTGSVILKVRFQWIRTGLGQKKFSSACAYIAVVDISECVSICCICLFWMRECCHFVHMPTHRERE